MADKSEKKILSEEDIDDLVESQADDDDAWDEPLSSLRHGVTADFQDTRQVVHGLLCEILAASAISNVHEIATGKRMSAYPQ